jgi:two-component system cell cycle sensor histidine kinase PleC
MSHELRTPLNAIVGFSELIKGQMVGPLSARYVEYARHIHDAGVHLTTQFEQMLDLAQAESGQLMLAKKPLSPGRLLHGVVKRLTGEAEAAGVCLQLEGDFDAWPQMEADEAKLATGIGNLIENAIKFSPPGATVNIKGARTRSMAKVAIADRGPGIPKDELPLVTRPFHRGKGAYDGAHQGAGVGLPFAKRIIELHGGALIIESEKGAGTTVTVCLPLMAASELAVA